MENLRLGVSAVRHDMKREETVEEAEKNTELGRQTPKRNVVSSSLAGGAKNDRCKPFLMVYSGFLLSSLLNSLAAPPERFYTFFAVCLLIGFELFSRSC